MSPTKSRKTAEVSIGRDPLTPGFNSKGGEISVGYEVPLQSFSRAESREDQPVARAGLNRYRVWGAIVIWDVDRLTRQTYELEMLLRVIDEKGAVGRVASAEGDYDLSNGDHQDILRNKVQFAQKESRDKSRRVKRANLQRKREGLPTYTNARNRRPFGYNFDHTTLNQEEATLLREAAKSLLQGSGTLSGICKKWDSQGVKTTTGKPWTYNALRGALLSPMKASLVEHEGELLIDKEGNYVDGQWEPVLTTTPTSAYGDC